MHTLLQYIFSLVTLIIFFSFSFNIHIRTFSFHFKYTVKYLYTFITLFTCNHSDVDFYICIFQTAYLLTWISRLIGSNKLLQKGVFTNQILALNFFYSNILTIESA